MADTGQCHLRVAKTLLDTSIIYIIYNIKILDADAVEHHNVQY